jgi:hypothetical protein
VITQTASSSTDVSVIAQCSVGKTVISGGCSVDPRVRITGTSRPFVSSGYDACIPITVAESGVSPSRPNAWQVKAYVNWDGSDIGSINATVTAICASLPN